VGPGPAAFGHLWRGLWEGAGPRDTVKGSNFFSSFVHAHFDFPIESSTVLSTETNWMAVHSGA